MSVIKIYAANGELLETRNERLDSDNLPTYAEQNNPERVQGYLDCLADMVEGLGEVVYRPNRGYTPNTNHKIATQGRKFLRTKEEFLEFAKAYIEKMLTNPKNPDSSETPTPIR